MKNTCSDADFKKTLDLPYLLGAMLGLNAVSDACLVVDGLPCIVEKADFIYGNHDLFSTLLSETGEHRIMCTATLPVNSDRNPEKQVAGILKSAAGSPRYSVVLLTGLPFLKLRGVDYADLARGVKARIPVVDLPSRSLEAGWLEGYEEVLDALARALPPAKNKKKKKRSAALVGYLMDRNEGDHEANLLELRRLAGYAGIELVSIWPSGGDFAELARAAGVELIISLPYGRRAARTLAGKFGAKLVETDLPLGLGGTRKWLSAVCRAAGTAVKLPKNYLREESAAAAAISTAFPVLAHKKVLFSGDPYLFSAFAGFASELCMRPSMALLSSAQCRLTLPQTPHTLLFRPSLDQARELIGSLGQYEKPDLAVMNSFAIVEKIAPGVPCVELGFPSYGHHCLGPEPFLGLGGARVLVSRLLNSLRSVQG